jgi:hypothetical protein
MVVLVFYPFLCDVMTLGLFFIFVFLLGLNDMVDRIFFSLVFSFQGTTKAKDTFFLSLFSIQRKGADFSF